MHGLTGKKPAYFDYAATTPVDPRVVEAMLPYWSADGTFGNASSSEHPYGFAASQAVEMARKKTALLVKSRSSEIVWVSGATEANNLAIQGVLKAAKKPLQLITVCTEHNAVLDVAKAMGKQGYKTTVLPVTSKGIVRLDKLQECLGAGKSLVSIMWVNNETGVIQPIEEISRMCRKHGALLHVDAAQAVGKLGIDLRKIPLDLMSMSAHKIYGPKGIGALFVRRGVRLQPLAWGGGQEKNLRPGTLAVPLIVGMGKACELVSKEWKKQTTEAGQWHELVGSVIQQVGGKINGDREHKVPHILSASFENISGKPVEALTGVALSSSAACSTAKVTVSHVLRGMGIKKTTAMNSVRVSFGRFTTMSEVQLLNHLLFSRLPLLQRSN